MTMIDKLNLKKYNNLAVLDQPSDYDLFNGYKTELTRDHDAVFIFVETVDQMVTHTERIINEGQLLEKGYLFFSYPKKGNKRYDTFVHRDEIFPALSVDDVFTVIGLKREKKKVKQSSAVSQCVADYQDNVKDVE